MAENLGQIDVVIQSDNQTLPMPGGGAGVGGVVGGGGSGGSGLAVASVGNVSKAAAGLGIVAIGAFAAKKAFDKVVNAIKSVIRTLMRWDSQVQGLINKFAQLNGSAALAGAITKLGEFTRNLKEAKILGPMLVQMTKARESFMKVSSAVSTAFNVIKITVLEAFFRVVTELVQPLIDSAGGIEGLTRAARICTVALLKMASTSLNLTGWAAKILSLVPGGGGMALGALGNVVLTISERLDEVIGAIKKQTQEEMTREEMKLIIEGNALTLGHLEHMTGGLWRHSTQVPLQAATGREINPRKWAAREAAKKQRRNP